MSKSVKKIPTAIRNAASAMLEPFGVDLNDLLSHSYQVCQIQDSRNFLELSTVAKDYGIGRWTIGRWIKKGFIKASKLSSAKSGKVLVDRKSLETFLASRLCNTGGVNA